MTYHAELGLSKALNEERILSGVLEIHQNSSWEWISLTFCLGMLYFLFLYFISASLYFFISCWGPWRHIQSLKPIELHWHLVINFLIFSWEGTRGRLYIIGLQKVYARWQVIFMHRNLTVTISLCSSFNYYLYTGDSQQFNLVEASSLGLRVWYSTWHLYTCACIPWGTSD